MSTFEYDLEICKRANLYQPFRVKDFEDNLVVVAGRDFSIACRIKESHSTDSELFYLTEENGGIVVDEPLGIFSISIPATDTDVNEDTGVYDVLFVDTNNPEIIKERILEGQISFTEGVT